jgi:hypothetical protein
VPDGRVLKTLHDAGHYLTALPKAAQERAEWQTAAEMLDRELAGDVRRHCDAALHVGKPVPTPKARRKPARKFRIVR